MKNSTRRNIRRLTTPFGVTLLVALAVSGGTGVFRGPITEAARGQGKQRLSKWKLGTRRGDSCANHRGFRQAPSEL